MHIRGLLMLTACLTISLGVVLEAAAQDTQTAPATAASRPTARSRPAPPPLTEEKIKNVTAAAPQQATAKPTQPRKVLVYNNTGPRGFVHGSIGLGAKTVEILGQKTGAFTVVVSSDPAVFEPDSLAQFDAIVLNNSSGDFLLPPNLAELPADQQQAIREREPRLKQSLLDFVSGGKGVVGIHAATDAYYRWPEYGKLIGAAFDGHPWTMRVGVKVDDPTHPLNAAFEGKGFYVHDEIYQFRAPYSRENLRVLLSLDVPHVDMTKEGIRRTDKDFAVSWVASYGKGRVFYFSLGHREEIFWTPALLRHLLDGIQFAIGDLPADTTPSAKLSPPPTPATAP